MTIHKTYSRILAISRSRFARSSVTARQAALVGGDTLAVGVAVFLAFLLRFDGTIPPHYFSEGVIATGIALIVVSTIFAFFVFRVYSLSWFHASVVDALLLGKGLLLSAGLVGLALFLFRDVPQLSALPRSILLASYLLVFLFAGGIRFSSRIWREGLRFRAKKKDPVLIVGAGEAGVQLIRSMFASDDHPHIPVAFVDDDRTKRNSRILGVPIMGRIEEIPVIVERMQIRGVIVALPSAGSSLIRQAVELARSSGIQHIRIVPPLSELLDGSVSLRKLREVRVEDLLGRKLQVLGAADAMGSRIQGEVILVTGAAGSIGSELCRQVARFKPRLLVLFDQDESGLFFVAKELEERFPSLAFVSIIGDILDEEKVFSVCARFSPRIIFHAAAYKHVPLMEENPDEAVRNNVFGTLTVANAAIACGVERFVFISTDKAVNPTSVMGATKRVGEMVCQALNQQNHTKFISVRFGNVLGSRGSVVPIFQDHIKRGVPIPVTHPEMTRYFMATSEACLLVMEAGMLGEGGEVFVLDMGEPIKIVDLARELIRLSGLEPDADIPIIFTGVRAGEKLFEEILNAEEGIEPTNAEGIFRVRLSSVEYEEILLRVEDLRTSLRTADAKTVRSMLCHMVPTYSKKYAGEHDWV